MNEMTEKRALLFGVDAIGGGIAVRFAREGAALAIIDANLAAGEDIAQTILAAGGKAQAFAASQENISVGGGYSRARRA